MHFQPLALLSVLTTLLLSTTFTAALATPNSLRSRSHHKALALAERNAQPNAAAYNPFHSPEWQQIDDGVPAEKREVAQVGASGKSKRKVKRAKTCVPKSSSTIASAASSTVLSSSGEASAAASTTLKVVANPVTSGFVSSIASSPVSASESSSASAFSSSSSSPSSTQTPTPTPSATSTSTMIASSSSSTQASTAPITVDPEGNGPFDGETTYYVLGNSGTAIGACGNYLVDSDKIAAASQYLFDSWPGATGNPNNNPICGLYAKVHYQGNSVVVRIEDRCPGCAKRHLDLSPSAFVELAPLDVGLMDVTWEWVSGPNA